MLAVLFVVSASVTAWTETEIVWAFVVCGVVPLVITSRPRPGTVAVALAWPGWLLGGLHGVVSASTLWTIALYFAEAGAFVFGSGLAIVPFLSGACRSGSSFSARAPSGSR